MIMRRAAAFARFWYDFIVGDDWQLAAAVLAALIGTVVLAQAGLHAWWLLPAAVVVALSLSLWRHARDSDA